MQKYAKEKITSVSCCKRTCNNGFWKIFMLHFKKEEKHFLVHLQTFFLAKYLQCFYYQNDIEYFWGNWGCCMRCLVQYFTLLEFSIHILNTSHAYVQKHQYSIPLSSGKFWFCPSKVSKIQPPFPPREAWKNKTLPAKKIGFSTKKLSFFMAVLKTPLLKFNLLTPAK